MPAHAFTHLLICMPPLITAYQDVLSVLFYLVIIYCKYLTQKKQNLECTHRTKKLSGKLYCLRVCDRNAILFMVFILCEVTIYSAHLMTVVIHYNWFYSVCSVLYCVFLSDYVVCTLQMLCVILLAYCSIYVTVCDELSH